MLVQEVLDLPNIKSAKKRVLVAQSKNAQNKAAKSEMKTLIKNFDAKADEGDRAEAATAYKAAIKCVDKAAAKGLIHRNKAAHKKSQMTIRLNAID